MRIVWERSGWPEGRVDHPITWLSWIGLEDCPHEGYLGAGSQPGTVGVTLTSINSSLSATASERSSEHVEGVVAEAKEKGEGVFTHADGRRLNYNLRGHRSPIKIVEWNRQHKKLASCDEAGVCYVWICYDDRWSVELVNDRGVKIRDFVWSPSGDLALICYADSFVLVGSAQGTRIWSNTMTSDTTLCGTWLPGEQGVVVGTAYGELVLMNCDGGIVGRYPVWRDKPIEALAWSKIRPWEEKSTLCVCFRNGYLYFMRSCDDADPVVIDTNMEVKRIEWSSNGEYLVAVGVANEERVNFLKIFNFKGALVLSQVISVLQPQIAATEESSFKPISAVCWGYGDTRLFIAVETELLVGQVFTFVPSLRLLAADCSWSLLKSPNHIQFLPLPPVEKVMIEIQSRRTVQCHIPDMDYLEEYVCRPSPWRWYCTIVPEPQLATHLTATFTLCVEHLGGLVPVLRGRQVNIFRPEFEIRLYRPEEDSGAPQSVPKSSSTSDPQRDLTPPLRLNPNRPRSRELSEPPSTSAQIVQSKTTTPPDPQTTTGGRSSATLRSTHSATDSPISAAGNLSAMGPPPGPCNGFSRDTVWRRSKRQLQQMVQKAHSQFTMKQRERKLVQVVSNLWCTRFKILGLESGHLPQYLGQVVYKTSVLHLQPRQMSVHCVDLDHNAELETAGHRRSSSGADSTLNPTHHPCGLFDGGDIDDDFGCLPNSAIHSTLEDSFCQADANLMSHLNDEGPPVAPLPGEIFRGAPAARLDEDEDYLLHDEQILTEILSEFDDLKLAVDSHIKKMRDFSQHLQESTQRPSVFGTFGPSSDSNNNSRVATTHSADSRRPSKNPKGRASKSVTLSEGQSEGSWVAKTPEKQEASSTATATETIDREVRDSWSKAIQELHFIDDEESPGQVISPPSLHKTALCHPYEPDDAGLGRLQPVQPDPDVGDGGSAFAKFGPVDENTAIKTRTKQLKEISQVLDRLHKLACELTPWKNEAQSSGAVTGGHQASSSVSTSSKISPFRKKFLRAMEMEAPAPPGGPEAIVGPEIYERLQDLSHRIGDLETRIHSGNELIEEIRKDLHQRIQRIRRNLSAKADVSEASATLLHEHSGLEACSSKCPLSSTCSTTGPGTGVGMGGKSSGGETTEPDTASSTLILCNKAPFWNENSQVYQLDFGGRVTQESAKNFQIEYKGKQVMQFGRIEGNAYTLDFQAPFTAVQAFAVALASITQRLK